MSEKQEKTIVLKINFIYDKTSIYYVAKTTLTELELQEKIERLAQEFEKFDYSVDRLLSQLEKTGEIKIIKSDFYEVDI